MCDVSEDEVQSAVVLDALIADHEVSAPGKLSGHEGESLWGSHCHDALISQVVVQLLMQEGALQTCTLELLSVRELLQLRVVAETHQHGPSPLQLLLYALHQELVISIIVLDGEGLSSLGLRTVDRW